MEKLKLKNGKLLDLIPNGIHVSDSALEVSTVCEDSLTELYDILSDEKNTGKMALLSEEGEEIAVYGGYTILESMAVKPDGQRIIEVRWNKQDMIAARLSSAEEQITDAQLALVELYEMIGG